MQSNTELGRIFCRQFAAIRPAILDTAHKVRTAATKIVGDKLLYGG